MSASPEMPVRSVKAASAAARDGVRRMVSFSISAGNAPEMRATSLRRGAVMRPPRESMGWTTCRYVERRVVLIAGKGGVLDRLEYGAYLPFVLARRQSSPTQPRVESHKHRLVPRCSCMQLDRYRGVNAYLSERLADHKLAYNSKKCPGAEYGRTRGVPASRARLGGFRHGGGQRPGPVVGGDRAPCEYPDCFDRVPVRTHQATAPAAHADPVAAHSIGDRFVGQLVLSHEV